MTLNLLCLDLAELTTRERRMLRLYEGYGLSISDLADLYVIPTAKVRRVLTTARRKYKDTYRKVKW